MFEDIVDLRRWLHSNPELSGNERNTNAMLVSLLECLSPTHLHQNVGGCGIVAVWHYSDSAKTVAFRADIDALPINETLDVPYKSVVDGVSHKCGHDGHAAILLKLAELVAANKPKLNIVLIFQAEEETGNGAKNILDSGVLDKYSIDEIYGFHNLPKYPLNAVVLKHGTFAAASVGVVIKMQGRQTHAAHPEKGINPDKAIASIINSMTKYNQHYVDTNDVRQATLIYIDAGEVAFGTAAGNAEIGYTLRAFTNNAMSELQEFLNAELGRLKEEYGLEISTEYREPFAATENNNESVDVVKQVADKLETEVCQLNLPFRWSEDFAEYLKCYKGAFFGVGAGTECLELHHPNYDFPDDIIIPTANFLFAIAKEFEDRND